MLTTTTVNNLQVEVRDSTVYVLPGAARIGNNFMSFSGGQIPLNQMIVSGDSSKYRNVLLYLQSVGDMPDMTKVVSSASSTIAGLSNPLLPTDGTFTSYAPGYPIKMFTLYTGDGTNASIIS